MNPIKLRHSFEHDPPTQNGPAMHAAVFHRRVSVTAFLAAAFFALAVVVSVGVQNKQGTPVAKRQSKSEKPKQVPLSDKDRELLEGLLRSFVFDPKGAKRVRVEWTRRGAGGESKKVNRAGWLVKGQGKTQARVYFADGLFIFAPEGQGKIEELDFCKECNKRFDAIKKKKTVKKGNPFSLIDPDAWKPAADSMRRNAAGEIGEPDLVLAAWLYRLGHIDLFPRALQHARETRGSDSILVHLQKEVAWAAFARLVHCFMVGEDDEALRAGERLLSEIPGGPAAFPWAKPIVADLKRRKTKGTFGRVKSDPLPKGFQNWKVERKIAFLVDALEDVAARQTMQPGGVPLGHDHRVRALVKIGDKAMPTLLNTIEKDDRLTRSVGFWRDFHRQRYVETVRSAARWAVADILDVGDAYKWPLTRLRRFWKENGGRTKAARLRKILTDPTVGLESSRQAAQTFTHLDPYDFDKPAETFWGVDQDKPNQLDPRIAKLTKPTVAEAILAALDRDLARIVGPDPYRSKDDDRKRAENTFLNALADIGDRRIVNELERRYKKAKRIRLRHRLAYTAYRLGNPRPMKDFARRVEEGSIKLPKSEREYDSETERPENIMLRGIVNELANVDLPETNRALYALANPKHKYYPTISRRILLATAMSGPYSEEDEWGSHPYFLIILRNSLNDKAPTGAKYHIKGERLSEKFKTGELERPVPDFLSDPNVRLNAADGRVCDYAAARLTDSVSGIPPYHPLLKNSDARLEEVKRQFDLRMKYGFRRFFGDSSFIPHIPPLGRPATDADVKRGRAIFHLGGKGRLAPLRLPAVAVINESRKQKEAKGLMPWEKTKAFIYQAEVDEKGTTHYGICSWQGILTVTGDKLAEIREVRHSAKLLIAYPPPKAKSK